MANHISLAILESVGLAAAGCSSQPVVRETREAPTGIVEGEAIAFLVASYRSGSGMGRLAKEKAVDHLAEIERNLDSCLRRKFLEVRDGLEFVTPRTLGDAAFPGQQIVEISLSTADFLERLTDGGVLRHGGLARLRYVVLLVGTEWDSDPMPHWSGPGVASITGQGWIRDLRMNATVLDVVHKRIAGSVSAHSRGEQGGGLGFIYVLPVPYYYSSLRESAVVCSELGQALVWFIVQ